jgi:hypothetical protein
LPPGSTKHAELIRDNIQHSHWEIRWAVLRHLTLQPAEVQAPFLPAITSMAESDYNERVNISAKVILLKHHRLVD